MCFVKRTRDYFVRSTKDAWCGKAFGSYTRVWCYEGRFMDRTRCLINFDSSCRSIGVSFTSRMRWPIWSLYSLTNSMCSLGSHPLLTTTGNITRLWKTNLVYTLCQMCIIIWISKCMENVRAKAKIVMFDWLWEILRKSCITICVDAEVIPHSHSHEMCLRLKRMETEMSVVAFANFARKVYLPPSPLNTLCLHVP